MDSPFPDPTTKSTDGTKATQVPNAAHLGSFVAFTGMVDSLGTIKRETLSEAH